MKNGVNYHHPVKQLLLPRPLLKDFGFKNKYKRIQFRKQIQNLAHFKDCKIKSFFSP